jgi:hypothetical protein
MDDRQFDALTREAAARRTRRGVVAALAGAVIGGTALLLGDGQSGAAPGCRGAGQPCEGNQQCCAGLVCVASGSGNSRRCTPAPTRTPTSTSTP